jgi:hypothetical protein
VYFRYIGLVGIFPVCFCSPTLGFIVYLLPAVNRVSCPTYPAFSLERWLGGLSEPLVATIRMRDGDNPLDNVDVDEGDGGLRRTSTHDQPDTDGMPVDRGRVTRVCLKSVTRTAVDVFVSLLSDRPALRLFTQSRFLRSLSLSGCQ